MDEGSEEAQEYIEAFRYRKYPYPCCIGNSAYKDYDHAKQVKKYQEDIERWRKEERRDMFRNIFKFLGFWVAVALGVGLLYIL